MSTAKKSNLVSVEEYLANELESPIKHEYLGGLVYAMEGFSNLHNTIAANILVATASRLRGSDCMSCGSATKIRIKLSTEMRFYYPDASIVCPPNPQNDSFQDEPVVVAEVLSQGTRRLDECEKQDAYLTIPSLALYLLVEQEFPAVVVLRRIEFVLVREVYEGLGAVIPMPEIGIELPLAEIYERVEFTSGVDGDENVSDTPTFAKIPD